MQRQQQIQALQIKIQTIQQKLDRYECAIIYDAPDNSVRITLPNGIEQFYAYEAVIDMLSQGMKFNPKTREPWPFSRVEDVQVDAVAQGEIRRLKQARSNAAGHINSLLV